MGNRRPAVFIGSSSEGKKIAEAVQVNLDDECDSCVWDQGIFGLGGVILDDLAAKLSEFDFAVMVITPDDTIEWRGESQRAPRDNVVLEIGLSIGVLGRKRTFLVCDSCTDIKLPSDLQGMTYATFHLHGNGNRQSSVGAAAARIKMAIEEVGLRERACDMSAAILNRLHHISLPVSDLTRSEDFYRNILGLRQIEKRPGFPFHGAWFILPSGQELHLVDNPNGTFRPHRTIEPRDCHFAIGVRDWGEACKLFEERGIEHDIDPFRMNFRQLYLLDPDNHVIEVNALPNRSYSTEKEAPPPP